MKSLKKLIPVAVLLAAVSVSAQTGGSGTPPPASVKKALTLPDMKARVTAMQTQVNEDAQHMRHLQKIARDQRDVIKLTCVNDKLVEVKASLNLFDSHTTQFNADADRGADVARPAYAELEKISSDVKELRGAADGCIGAPDLYKQESGVEVQHPDFPDDPTGVDPFGAEVEPPVYASPFS